MRSTLCHLLTNHKYVVGAFSGCARGCATAGPHRPGVAREYLTELGVNVHPEWTSLEIKSRITEVRKAMSHGKVRLGVTSPLINPPSQTMRVGLQVLLVGPPEVSEAGIVAWVSKATWGSPPRSEPLRI